MIIQDMQNDVMMDGGAFAASGSPQHAREQNVIENIRRLAEACRARGVMIIHVWFVVEPGAPGVTLNAPLFEGFVDTKAMVRGTWGSAPVAGLEPQPGDHRRREDAHERLRRQQARNALRAGGRDTIIDTGAWTNMSIEHTARTGADKGYFVIVPEDCCSTMNADWHRASIQYAMQNVAAVTKSSEVIAALGSRSLPLIPAPAEIQRQRACSPVFLGPAFAGMSDDAASGLAGSARLAGERALHRGPAGEPPRVFRPAREVVSHVERQDRPAPGPIDQQVRIGDAVALTDRPGSLTDLLFDAPHRSRHVFLAVAATSSTACGSAA